MTAVPALTIERTDFALPAPDLEAAAAFARNEKAPATRAAYRADFRLFGAWCNVKGVDARRLGPCVIARKRKGGGHQGKSALHLFTSSRMARRLLG